MRFILFFLFVSVTTISAAHTDQPVAKEKKLYRDFSEKQNRRTKGILAKSRKISVKELNERLEKSEEILAKMGSRSGTKNISFIWGELEKKGSQVVWIKNNGERIVLFDLNSIFSRPKGFNGHRRLSSLIVSPNAELLAVSYRRGGHDHQYWHIVRISENPEILTRIIRNGRTEYDPIVSRAGTGILSWADNSQSVYYTYFARSERKDSDISWFTKVKRRDLLAHKEKGPIKDRDIFVQERDMGYHGVESIDGGKKLIVFRHHVNDLGFKTPAAIYILDRLPDGSYKQRGLELNNKESGFFVRHSVHGKVGERRILVQTENGRGIDSTHSGLVSVNIDKKSLDRKVVIPSVQGQVLFISKVFNDDLFLLYNKVSTREVLYKVYDFRKINKGRLNTKLKPIAEKRVSDFGDDLVGFSNGGLGVEVAPGAKDMVLSFTDALFGSVNIRFDFSSKEFERLPVIKPPLLSKSNFAVFTKEALSKDGTRVPYTIYLPRNTNGEIMPPKKYYLRYYGSLGFINRAESKELQMILNQGNAYIIVNARGGGEFGTSWSRAGIRDKYKTAQDVVAVSKALQYQGVRVDQINTMGRSWGGHLAAILYFVYGNEFANIFMVAPVVNMRAFVTKGRGTSSHSQELHPEFDELGKPILGEDYWRSRLREEPFFLLNREKEGFRRDARLYIFASQYDDRLDLVHETRKFVDVLLKKSGAPGTITFYEQAKANHGSRYYLPWLDVIMSDE